jgi:hypothetical protein
MPLPAPPTGPLWGLDDSWQGGRRRGGTSSNEGWLAYSLIHVRGMRDGSAAPILIVDHIFVDQGQPYALAKAAGIALMIYAGEQSDSKPAAQLIHEQVARKDLGPAWTATTVQLGDASIDAYQREVSDGLCIVAEAHRAVLAIYARGVTETIRLVAQEDYMDTYEGEP